MRSAQRKRDVLSCHICNEEYDMVSAIRRHYSEQHPGMKPFACESCGKRFDRKENLNRHVRIHTGDRRYVCNHCGKGYTDPSGLKKHVLSKHSHIQFPCNVCNANFKSKDSLNRHLTKHLTELKYKKDKDDYNVLTKLSVDDDSGQTIKVFIQAQSGSDVDKKDMDDDDDSRQNILTTEGDVNSAQHVVSSDKGLEQLQEVIHLQQYADSGAVQVQYIQVSHNESHDKDADVTSSSEEQNHIIIPITAQVMSVPQALPISTQQVVSMSTSQALPINTQHVVLPISSTQQEHLITVPVMTQQTFVYDQTDTSMDKNNTINDLALVK